MPKDKADLILTPPPNFDSHQLGEAIIGARKDIKFIREDLLPPLVQDSREARDTANEALLKVDTHIDNADHDHECIEQTRQMVQDNKLADLIDSTIESKSKVSGLDKWRWWLMGSIVGIAVIIGSVVFSMSNSSVEHSVKLESYSKNITENKTHINELEKSQQRDRELYLKTVNGLPARVQEAAQKQEPTLVDLEAAVEDFELTNNEERLLLNVIKRAKKRNGNGDRR